jgi:hypothetical protein
MRLLVKCPHCGQKYDASKRKVGGRFRCRCGEVVTIGQPKSHEAEVIHCAGCGASREEEARACKYCGSDFTIHELDLNTVCPGCLARVSDRARFCHHCASPLSSEAVAGDETLFRCPACEDRQLVTRRLESISTTALECQVCAGLWIGLESFHDLLNQEARGNSGQAVSHRRQTGQPPPAKRYRPCPVCRDLMTPRHFGQGKSGILLDVCGTDGLWFDCDELSHLIAWMRSGGLESVRKDVGRLKGSPDAVRKRILSEEGAPKVTTASVVGGSYGDWDEETRRRDGIDIVIEVGIPFLFAAGSAVAKIFSK